MNKYNVYPRVHSKKLSANKNVAMTVKHKKRGHIPLNFVCYCLTKLPQQHIHFWWATAAGEERESFDDDVQAVTLFINEHCLPVLHNNQSVCTWRDFKRAPHPRELTPSMRWTCPKLLTIDQSQFCSGSSSMWMWNRVQVEHKSKQKREWRYQFK